MAPLTWKFQSKTFNNVFLIIILVNCVTIAIEASIKDDDASWGGYLDSIFLSLYSVEFIIKLYADRTKFFRSGYNRFDFAILLISWMQWILAISNVSLGNLTFLRIFRSLRALRSFRSISSVRRLQVIVNALLNTLRKNVIDIIACLILCMFLFAVIGYYMFERDKENWGSLGNAFMSLLLYVTASNWTNVQESLNNEDYVGSEYFSIAFMLIGNFIFTNMFIGVICQNIDEATEADRAGQLKVKLEAVKFKKQFLLKSQKKEMDILLGNEGSQGRDMQTLLQSLAGRLRHDEVIPMAHLLCNLTWIETYMVTLYYHENTLYRCQQTHFSIANTLAELMDKRISSRKARM
ncbi:Ion transport protein-domain-containing protein [Paraphysoderma sedebokerense]|nr:Ion transport protein-domain-containing protein [Paraphysoderma sedebokerense]